MTDDVEDAADQTAAETAAPRVVRKPRGPAGKDQPSLSSPLLSGRSLQPTTPTRRLDIVREHPAITVTALVIVLLLLAIGIGKWSAERTADSATQRRADDIAELLTGATPDDFLAFNAGVKTPGSLASRVRDQDGFVNVKAMADLSFIRFQPSGWWAGFTERCIVAVIRPDGVSVTVPKTACLRVDVPDR